jgi:hypothetical protein
MFEDSLLGTAAWFSKQCALTWKAKVTKQGRLLYQLSPSVRVIAETEYGLWRTIKTKKGQEIKVSEVDYEKVSKQAWHVQNGYVRGCINRTSKITMHKLLMGEPPQGMEIDHINRDKLDNRRENLRFVTKSENAHNRGMGTGCVWYEPRLSKWRAEIRENGKKKHLGVFLTEEEARSAYIAAKILLMPRQTSQLLPTPEAKNQEGYQVANGKKYLRLGSQTGQEAGKKLRLQPAMTAWMMGFPENWTELPIVENEPTP